MHCQLSIKKIPNASNVEEIFLHVVNRLLENVVLNAVVFFGFFRVVPAVCCADEVLIGLFLAP